jgi:hypothetical protein
MTLIGIRLENPDNLVRSILQYTSGHPYLIQFLCEQVLNNLPTGNRLLTLQDVDNVYQRNNYRQTYLDTFWSQSRLIDKAISVCVSELGNAKTIEIRSRLEELGFSISGPQLQNGIRYLNLCHILTSAGESYSTRFDTFKECLTSFYTYEQWYNDFKE